MGPRPDDEARQEGGRQRLLGYPPAGQEEGRRGGAGDLTSHRPIYTWEVRSGQGLAEPVRVPPPPPGS